MHSTDYVVFLAVLSGSLLWVTRSNIGTEATVGIKDRFLRTLRAEFNGKRIVSLSLEDVNMDSSECISHIARIFTSAFEKNSTEVEFVIRESQILTGRLVRDARLNHELSSLIYPETKTSPWLPGPPLKLHVGSRWRLDTLHFREDIEYYEDLGPTDVEIEAKAWAVNFRDVFGAVGRLDNPGFGSDCAGIVTRVGPQCKLVRPGDHVCMCIWDCMRMFPRSDEQTVVKIPSSVSFEEACAVIIPGMTAWHSLIELARLGHGEKVLIHSASGATGQLAIQIAQMVGAEVFATVGYDDKKQLLIEKYNIPEDHIFYSRSNNTTFAKGIMRMTNGYGVDVVLNSLVGQGLRASWDCIAPYGRFIEIGKADINGNASLPMGAFANNVMFAAVDLRLMGVERKQMASKLLHKVMSLTSEGSIHCPKPLHVYGVDAVDDAFRYVQSGKNAGRVIIRIDASTEVQVRIVTPIILTSFIRYVTRLTRHRNT
jgi:NADPH:quinone reductase-like Zn-dependent oxidoreductase